MPIARRARGISGLGQDIRYPLRSLAASAAMFSVLDAVVLHPLPVADEDRLAMAIVLGAAGLAGYWPTRRASQVDPLVILRSE